MTKKILTLTITLFTFSALAHKSQGDYLVEHNLVDGPHGYGDSGIPYPKYSDVEKGMNDLALKYPREAKVVQYGKTVKGRNLTLLRIEKLDRDASFVNAPAVELSGTIHGNEYLGVEDKLAGYFLDHQNEMPGLSAFLAKGGVLYSVPIVNPDGFESRSRANAHGSDLNRDFDVLPTQQLKFREVESKSLAQYLDGDLTANNLKLKLTFDYHCCVPALVTPWTYADLQVSASDQPTFNKFYKTQTATLGYKIGNAAATVNYLAVGTTVDYFYAKYGAVGLTLEGKYGGEFQNFQKHIQMWDAFFKEVAN